MSDHCVLTAALWVVLATFEGLLWRLGTDWGHLGAMLDSKRSLGAPREPSFPKVIVYKKGFEYKSRVFRLLVLVLNENSHASKRDESFFIIKQTLF